MFISTLFSLLLPALVSAHGYVNKVTIDGTVYQGNPVGTSPSINSAIRQVNTNSPVKGATNPDINCGAGAQVATDVANANPGSTVQVYWVGGTSGNGESWPHNTGPIMHYMAQCTGTCSSYNSSGAKWFKISEQGYQPGNTTWYQAQLQSGQPATVTIPSTLAAGNYLLRSEIIALQIAQTEGGAEFYPSCIQLSVGGTQTGQPTSNEEVTLPGAYSDTDPGILTPNVYNPGFSSTYVFPGPPVASFASSGSTSTGSGPSSTVPTSSSASSSPSSPVNVGGNPPSSATPSPTSTGGTGSTCMRKRSPDAIVEGKRMHRRRYRPSRKP